MCVYEIPTNVDDFEIACVVQDVAIQICFTMFSIAFFSLNF